MKSKIGLLLLSLSLFISCNNEDDKTIENSLKNYLNLFSNQDFGNVIACAASENNNENRTFIFYYPENGATEINYFETENNTVNPNDFSKYSKKNYEIENVFGGKLQRFIKPNDSENWGLVTYVLNGKLHKSNPIRLKNKTKLTTYSNEISINNQSSLEPVFSWTDQTITDNAIYFQVISEYPENRFISGTYTFEKTFSYFYDDNVVNNINVPLTPENLLLGKDYLFTLMAVSEDNWVNLVIQKQFSIK